MCRREPYIHYDHRHKITPSVSLVARKEGSSLASEPSLPLKSLSLLMLFS